MGKSPLWCFYLPEATQTEVHWVAFFQKSSGLLLAKNYRVLFGRSPLYCFYLPVAIQLNCKSPCQAFGQKSTGRLFFQKSSGWLLTKHHRVLFGRSPLDFFYLPAASQLNCKSPWEAFGQKSTGRLFFQKSSGWLLTKSMLGTFCQQAYWLFLFKSPPGGFLIKRPLRGTVRWIFVKKPPGGLLPKSPLGVFFQKHNKRNYKSHPVAFLAETHWDAFTSQRPPSSIAKAPGRPFGKKSTGWLLPPGGHPEVHWAAFFLKNTWEAFAKSHPEDNKKPPGSFFGQSPLGGFSLPEATQRSKKICSVAVPVRAQLKKNIPKA